MQNQGGKEIIDHEHCSLLITWEVYHGCIVIYTNYIQVNKYTEETILTGLHNKLGE